MRLAATAIDPERPRRKNLTRIRLFGSAIPIGIPVQQISGQQSPERKMGVLSVMLKQPDWSGTKAAGSDWQEKAVDTRIDR